VSLPEYYGRVRGGDDAQPSALVSVADGVHAAMVNLGFAGAAGFLLFVYLAIAVIWILAAVKVVTKAGYSGWWVLITFVPVVGFIMMLVFAFSEWPVVREARALRAQATGWQGYGSPLGRGGDWGVRGGGGSGAAPDPSGPSSPSDSYGGGASGWAAAPAQTDHPETEAPLPPFRAHTESAAPAQASTAQPAAAVERPEQAAQAPPGWYPVPDGRLRYWDGTAWTEHFA
jgi:hypothetical protein